MSCCQDALCHVVSIFVIVQMVVCIFVLWIIGFFEFQKDLKISSSNFLVVCIPVFRSFCMFKMKISNNI